MKLDCTGFIVQIILHTPEAEAKLASPELIRMRIGLALDNLGIEEEIDYTLQVSRTYGQTNKSS